MLNINAMAEFRGGLYTETSYAENLILHRGSVKMHCSNTFLYLNSFSNYAKYFI